MKLSSLSKADQFEFIKSLSDKQAAALYFDWEQWARPEQLAPAGSDWFTWVALAGRGWGKTKSGAEWVRSLAVSKYASRIALVGPTIGDVRDVMIEGDSGILACSPPWFRPVYQPSKRHKLTWPNGVTAFGYSAEEPNRLRGPQHGAAWCDEAAAWQYSETMDMLDFGLRLGERPLKFVTTTPKRTETLKKLLLTKNTVITRGSTFDNRDNLAPTFFSTIIDKYEGTTLGRQELYAELLADVEGALWQRKIIDDHRLQHGSKLPAFTQIAVAIDPTVSSSKGADEAGIMVGALGTDGHGYLLKDGTIKASPDKWARRAIDLANEYGANYIVAEANNGGELVKQVLQTVDPNVVVKLVWASQGKFARGEPIAALSEQGKIHHVGYFADLEDQMCTWIPGQGMGSPDRMDAFVWLFSRLMKNKTVNISSDDIILQQSTTAKEFGFSRTLTRPDF